MLVRPMRSLSATRGSGQIVLVNCRAAGESSLWGCASCADIFGRQVESTASLSPPSPSQHILQFVASQ